MSAEFEWCKRHRILYRLAEPGRHEDCNSTPEPAPPRAARKLRRKGVRALTVRQLQIIAAIRASVETKGYPPTRSEISAAVGTTTSCVAHHLQVLEAKGILRHDPRLSRALVLITPVGRDARCPSPTTDPTKETPHS